jgi:hypothetical protein
VSPLSSPNSVSSQRRGTGGCRSVDDWQMEATNELSSLSVTVRVNRRGEGTVTPPCRSTRTLCSHSCQGAAFQEAETPSYKRAPGLCKRSMCARSHTHTHTHTPLQSHLSTRPALNITPLVTPPLCTQAEGASVTIPPVGFVTLCLGVRNLVRLLLVVNGRTFTTGTCAFPHGNFVKDSSQACQKPCGGSPCVLGGEAGELKMAASSGSMYGYLCKIIQVSACFTSIEKR